MKLLGQASLAGQRGLTGTLAWVTAAAEEENVSLRIVEK